MKITIIQEEKLPALAWYAIYVDDALKIYCGIGVRVFENGVFEGGWSLTSTPEKCNADGWYAGSGIFLQESTIKVISPTHTLESVYIAVNSDLNEKVVSNSMALLLSVSPSNKFKLSSVSSKLFTIVKNGVYNYDRLIYEAGALSIYRYSLGIVDLLTLDVIDHIPEYYFSDYYMYVNFLKRVISDIYNSFNAREYSVFLSKGYDSVACAALASSLGKGQSFSIVKGRNNVDDDGSEIAKILGLNSNLIQDPYLSRNTFLKNKQVFCKFDKSDAEHLSLFNLGFGVSDEVLKVDSRLIQKTAVLTGFHGDLAWDYNARPSADIMRGDSSGASLYEFRLRAAFVHIPVPMIGILRHNDIFRISRSSDMKYWSVGGRYNRPIARRLGEEAGVPRSFFGQKKSAVATATEKLGELRDYFFEHLLYQYKKIVAPIQSFSRSYLFTKLDVDMPDYNVMSIMGYNLYYTNDLEVSCESNNSRDIVLLGSAFDIRESASSSKTVTRMLLKALDNNKFYEELDFVSGRYVVIYRDSLEIKVLSDATGMRSVFYDSNFEGISSHSKLLQLKILKNNDLSYVETNKSKDANGSNISYKYGYPGNLTPFKDNLILLPNFEINLNRKTVSRFYPRKNIVKNLDINDIIIEVNQYMKNQVSSILKLKKLVFCSLTAGLDSRYTLTATRDFEEIKYITYYYEGNATHSSDISYAKLISNSLNLNHFSLDVDGEYNYEGAEYKDFSEMLGKSTIYSAHGKKIAYAYYKEFGKDNILIRSNLYEIGRAFFHSSMEKKVLAQGDNSEITLGKLFTSLYNEKLLNNKYVCKAFTDYASQCTKDYLFNYDPIDMFYWEHRMGLWHSHVVTESDVSFETLVLCNSRKILELFLSLNLSERKAGILFQHSINQYLPELRNIPINKKSIDIYDKFNVHTYVENDTLHVEVACTDISKSRDYAYYVYLNEQRIDTRWYSKNSKLAYPLTRPGKYRVRAFIKDGEEKPRAKNSNTVTYLGGVQTLSLSDLDKGLVHGKNDIVSGNYIFETFYKKGHNNKLVILFNGAIGDRSKITLPVFQRNSWGQDIDDHVLNINDPTLYLANDLRLGWYYGTDKNPLVKDLEEIIIRICNVLKVSLKDVVLYGSSGGGFASLNIAAQIGNGIKAVAINPQIYLHKYVAKAVVNRFYDVCITGEQRPEISVDKLWLKAPEAYALIFQNKLDKHHYNIHFSPFIRDLGIEENSSNGYIENIIFEDERGHVGESRNDFLLLINKVRNMGKY